MTPLPDLGVVAPVPREVQPSTRRSPPSQGGVVTGSSSRPEIALKSPHTAAGKAQLAAATQKRGRGEGSKGIHLEDPSTPESAKRRRQEKPPAACGPGRPRFEDTYEESDDSDESFDGPFSGSSPRRCSLKHYCGHSTSCTVTLSPSGGQALVSA